MAESTVFSVRMTGDLAERVTDAAAEAGVNRNAWIVELLERATAPLTMTSVVVEPERSETPERKVRLTKASDLKVKACPHPKEMEQRLAWGTVCGQCKRKLR
jgi:hypothetical protein